MATRAIQHEATDVLSDYLALVAAHPLIAIQTDGQLDEAIAVIDDLLDKGELSDGEEQYLDALSVLIEAYESEHIPFPEISGVEVLRHIMAENDLRQSDLLDVFETRSVASEVMNGKRSLTLNHVRRLSERFRLPPEVFLGV
jgi:HTH-type transcriptional regulator/antitoxin HigA